MLEKASFLFCFQFVYPFNILPIFSFSALIVLIIIIIITI